MNRTLALLAKEAAELRRNPGIFLPAVITGFAALLIPFAVAVILPAITGEQLSSSGDLEIAKEMYAASPSTRHLSTEAAVQAWIFQQFLLLLALSPVAASMSVAASSVVAETQARTLEPLLATPITTFELLAAKTLAAFIPAVLLTAAMFATYVAAIGAFAQPGVAGVLLTPQPLTVMFLLAPLAALAALQLAVCMSSRTNDPRSAQQLGALIVLPMAALLVMQLMGAIVLTLQSLFAIAGALLLVNVLLAAVGVALFSRESILTRWK